MNDAAQPPSPRKRRTAPPRPLRYKVTYDITQEIADAVFDVARDLKCSISDVAAHLICDSIERYWSGALDLKPKLKPHVSSLRFANKLDPPMPPPSRSPHTVGAKTQEAPSQLSVEK